MAALTSAPKTSRELWRERSRERQSLRPRRYQRVRGETPEGAAGSADMFTGLLFVMAPGAGEAPEPSSRAREAPRPAPRSGKAPESLLGAREAPFARACTCSSTSKRSRRPRRTHTGSPRPGPPPPCRAVFRAVVGTQGAVDGCGTRRRGRWSPARPSPLHVGERQIRQGYGRPSRGLFFVFLLPISWIRYDALVPWCGVFSTAASSFHRSFFFHTFKPSRLGCLSLDTSATGACTKLGQKRSPSARNLLLLNTLDLIAGASRAVAG